LRRALDLFCGAGGASAGLALAGYEVTGVDIRPQPRYPFEFICGDAMGIELNGYDLIWASPPCQAFTKARKLRGRDHPDLIAPIRERLKASGAKYIIENVEGAPLLNPQLLCGAMFEGLRTYRHRLFETNFEWTPPKHPEHKFKTTKMGRPPEPDKFMHVVGNFSGADAGRKAMGIDWMVKVELREAIPPAYSEYIARFT
jgi:DNA (cytosine-5)-methyltransferase 1